MYRKTAKRVVNFNEVRFPEGKELKSQPQFKKNIIQLLWSGDIQLNDVFWKYAIVYGLIVNIISTVLLLLAFMFEWHAALISSIFLLPIPYNIFIAISVWKSADKITGQGSWPAYAKFITVLWFIFWTLV